MNMKITPTMTVCKLWIRTAHIYVTHRNKEIKLFLAHVRNKKIIAVIVSLQCLISAPTSNTKPKRLNVPLLITTRASTVQGGRRKALHAFYKPWTLQAIF
ncbi:hypothetical protein CHARACLAT_009664 [Characodon lateralis]|uniref:Uncharacterized protein n=1 Tax=Characodon lateralis TaxID=208331 RepID=A0ABU7F4U0_9TELE|nr:hypothetical protein [Characodon lateralis]